MQELQTFLQKKKGQDTVESNCRTGKGRKKRAAVLSLAAVGVIPFLAPPVGTDPSVSALAAVADGIDRLLGEEGPQAAAAENEEAADVTKAHMADSTEKKVFADLNRVAMEYTTQTWNGIARSARGTQDAWADVEDELELLRLSGEDGLLDSDVLANASGAQMPLGGFGKMLSGGSAAADTGEMMPLGGFGKALAGADMPADTSGAGRALSGNTGEAQLALGGFGKALADGSVSAGTGETQAALGGFGKVLSGGNGSENTSEAQLALGGFGKVLASGGIKPVTAGETADGGKSAAATVAGSATGKADKASAGDTTAKADKASTGKTDKTSTGSTTAKADKTATNGTAVKKEKPQKPNDLPSALSMEYNAGFAAMTLSAEQLTVLETIVEAEAGDEDSYGKILVANVVLNRVLDAEFPNTVKAVVFQNNGKTYQFSPVRKGGRYYTVKVSKHTKAAVARALAGEDYSDGALYFFARRYTSAKKANWFDTSLRKIVEYGCHEFFGNK